MNEEVIVVKEDGGVHLQFRGKTTNERIVDDIDIINFFKSVMLGKNSQIQNYHQSLVNKSSSRSENMSMLQNLLYYRKEGKRIKEAKSKMTDIEKRLKTIEEKTSIIIGICSKYGMNLDGTYKKDSKYKEIEDRLLKCSDAKIRQEFFVQKAKITSELAEAYKTLEFSLMGLSDYCAYFEQGTDLYYRFRFDRLTKKEGNEKTYLNRILNNCIDEKRSLSSQQEEYDSKIDFTEEAIQKCTMYSSKFNQFKFLRDSKKLNTKELEFLEKVESSHKEVAISFNKIDYLTIIINSLGYDERFINLKSKLEKQLEEEIKNKNNLMVAADDLYMKFNVSNAVELVKAQVKNEEEQNEKTAESIFSINSGDRDNKSKAEYEYAGKVYEGKIIKGRTLYAQYLRERAFGTPDGKLPFPEYAQKYAYLFGLTAEYAASLSMEEMEVKSGRKL